MIRDRLRVAVVGAGAFGARHVQAMAKVDAPVDLDIIDPAAEARQRAVSLLTEAGGLKDGRVRQVSRIEDLDAAPDFGIVATTSLQRPSAVRTLVDFGVRMLILEKVLFTRLSDYDAIDDLFCRTGVQAWVNCPRRSYPRAHRLKEFVGSSRFAYRVEGQGWGLGCNLVHHLDEFVSLAGRQAISLNAEGLDAHVAAARRPGYVEFFGRISGDTPEKSRFEAICTSGAPGTRVVTISNEDERLTISADQTLTISDGSSTRTEPFPMPPQSQMTADYVIAIHAGKSPDLPDYPSASRLHRTMITAFIDHLRRVRQDDSINECLVT